MKFYLVILTYLFSAVLIAAEHSDKMEKQAIAKVLNTFHQAAADANGQVYFSLLADDAVFLGTDAKERWNKEEFKSFALPYFNQGKGWSYQAKKRNISFTQAKAVAFFDELLFNEKYGHCRGSGVLEKTASGWQISQYNLTITLPNEIAGDITQQIKHFEKKMEKEQVKGP